MASDDPDRENPLQRWIDAEQRWDDPEERWGDPESQWGDPEAELSTAPESPEPDPDEIEVDPLTKRYFWQAVALANVAVAGVGVGALLVVFTDAWELGGGLVLVGLLAGIRTHRLAKRFQADERTGGERPSSGEGSQAESDAVKDPAGEDEM